MKDPPSFPDLPDVVSFTLQLRHWEFDNLEVFCEGRLSQRLFLAFVLATCRHTSTIRLTELFVDGNASEVGIRKRLKRYQKLGLIEIIPNPADKRSKLVRITDQLEQLLTAYFTVADKLWLKHWGSGPSRRDR